MINRENLKKLATYLLTEVPAAEFGMATYNKAGCQPCEPQCGTVACAAGYGPRAGIPAKPSELWYEYCQRSFFADLFSGEFTWCFGSIWVVTDNTPQGAAKRILWLLDHGLPEDWEAQMFGYEPLCYLEQA